MEGHEIPPVAEIQGLYGPLKILEGKVQQIWALQSLQPGKWWTASGSRLAVRNPGSWNRGAGPDFKDAVIELDGAPRVGDIEIHLYREDWWRHGHHIDPAYDAVVLHVVLFSGGMEARLRTAAGNCPDEWAMGPWLREDVESVVGGEPGLFGELVPELCEWVEAEPSEAIRERLRTGADRRWSGKEAMARCLIRSHGWEGALHRLCLFHMGYPHNRKSFFTIAESIPAESWAEEGVVREIRERFDEAVRWHHGRPANRAEKRLRQYAMLNRTAPDWMRILKQPPRILAGTHPEVLPLTAQKGTTNLFRKSLAMKDWQHWIEETVMSRTLNQGMVRRLWIDVVLPLMVAGEVIDEGLAFALWFHAPAAMIPDAYFHVLKRAGLHVRAGFPACNGWMQGLIWVDDQMRLERVRTALPVPPPATPDLTS